ncbi:hypothetical protein [Mycoplasma sp. CSL7503-lung]|uniref:hypothetical protein n=1 Tax=Mycoplasma sp. CSL7503-lung TaxID=536372 RepID=UPI0021D29376|nr:hypothetical protein [Mycoplasma sp. CSL7503-lung]MCU4706296.1 hypothetical protein [Mycoplasma sp. CSL7503-lung]
MKLKKILPILIGISSPFLVISCGTNLKEEKQNNDNNSNNISIIETEKNNEKDRLIKVDIARVSLTNDALIFETSEENINKINNSQITLYYKINGKLMKKSKIISNSIYFDLENIDNSNNIEIVSIESENNNIEFNIIDKNIKKTENKEIERNVNEEIPDKHNDETSNQEPKSTGTSDEISENEDQNTKNEENNQDLKDNQEMDREEENNEITNPGTIGNPKNIFSLDSFPKNIVLEDNRNNRIIVENYFKSELYKAVSFINGDNLQQPEKWTQLSYQNYDKFDAYKNIPNLIVKFKKDDKTVKFINKIMPVLIQDNDLKLENNEVVINRNVINFLNKDFQNKKITFYIKINNQNMIETLPITIDLNNINDSFYEIVEEKYDFEFNAILKNEMLTVKVRNKNSKNFSFTKNDENNIFVDRFGTTSSISYETEKDSNFTLFNSPGNTNLSTLNSNEEFYKNNNSAKRLDVQNNQDALFKKIRERVFVVGGGTMTMLSKVKPNDSDDQRYYFITNRHVVDILNSRWSDSRVMKKFMIPHYDDSLVRNSNNQISIDIQKEWFNFGFWESANQTNRNGTLTNNGTQNADIAISIIDIKPILDHAKETNNLEITNYLNKWKELKPIKLSKYSKGLSEHSNVDFRISSFPLDNFAGFSGRRYREHIINKIDKIELNDQAAEFEKYGHFRTFILKDTPSNKLDLISGASGSVVFDQDLNMVALFMQNIGNDDQYGFGLLSSNEYDYFGFETDNNPNSFKNKLKSEIEKNPEKFENIEF